MNILSSLDRAGDGSVSASNITVARQDLSTTAGVLGSGTDLSPNATLSAAAATNAGNAATVTIAADADMSDNALTINVGGATLNYSAAISLPSIRMRPRVSSRARSTPWASLGSRLRRQAGSSR